MPITKEERERRKQVTQRWRLLKRVRQAVQLALLAVFLFLIYNTTRANAGEMPVNLFSRFDPLMAFVSMVGTRSFIRNMIPALVTVVVTLLLGRVWCGWICPLGTVLDLFGPNVRSGIPKWFRHVKYFVLFAFVAVLWMDPITMFVRPLAGTIYPALVKNVEAVQAQPSLFAEVVDVRAATLTEIPVIYPLLALPLVLVLAFNLVARRFWCRYLCPLGAFIAFLSKFAFIKRFVQDGCVKCKKCVSTCPMDTISPEDFTSDPGECLQCLNCYGTCATAGITLRAGWDPGFGYDYDPDRRKVVASVATGLVGAGLLNSGFAKSKYPFQLRPPGAEEEQFLAQCIRCGQCIKVCPNNALHLALLEAGVESIWSPLLVPRIGHCAWDCNACGQICPTQAIPKLSLEEKRKAKIGLAATDFDLCIRCLQCQPVCPTEAITNDRVGERRGKYPLIDPEKCNGCGVCEYICPVEGVSAIRVYRPDDVPTFT